MVGYINNFIKSVDKSRFYPCSVTTLLLTALLGDGESEAHIGLFDNIGKVLKGIIINATTADGAIGIKETDCTTINDDRSGQKRSLTDNAGHIGGEEGF